MELEIYFQPLNPESIAFKDSMHENKLGKQILLHFANSFPDLEGIDIAILGVNEDRQAFNNAGCGLAPDYIRKYLYRLFSGNFKPKIADLGNIQQGHEIEDTYFALRDVLAQLIEKKIIPIIIGGSQDLTYANYLAYEKIGKIINIASIDSKFDIGKTNNKLHSKAYLSKIILHQPNHLFNFSNIGYQTYFVDQEAIELMQKLYFDVYRLGEIRANITEIEPIIRNADIISFDISSVRQSDAPGNGNATPNGFYGEEVCQLIRYAGISDKVSSIGFYEYNPVFDRDEQTAHLVSQMIWYFIEGFYSRKKDFPETDKENFIIYRVGLNDNKDITFYKSKKSDRWWMEVPFPKDFKQQFERHHIVPCSYSDYEAACNQELPERWWQVYQKLM